MGSTRNDTPLKSVWQHLAPFMFDKNAKQYSTDLSRFIFEAIPSDYSTLLDIACGIGLHAKFFSSMGLRVTAVDSEVSFLDQINAESKNITTHLGDMRTLDLQREYDCVCLLGNSLGFSKNRSSDLSTLECMASHCGPSGSIILDINTPETIRNTLQKRNSSFKNGNTQFKQLVSLSHEDDTATYIWSFENSSNNQITSFDVSQNLYSLEWYEEVLNSIGFEHINAFSGISGARYDPNSSARLILIASRIPIINRPM